MLNSLQFCFRVFTSLRTCACAYFNDVKLKINRSKVFNTRSTGHIIGRDIDKIGRMFFSRPRPELTCDIIFIRFVEHFSNIVCK